MHTYNKLVVLNFQALKKITLFYYFVSVNEAKTVLFYMCVVRIQYQNIRHCRNS